MDDAEIIYNDDYEPKYSLLECLGEGTYGKVYLASHVQTYKVRVLKQMKRSESDEGVPSTELREASLLQSLRHPNIVRLEDLFLTQSSGLCLVFEHCRMDLSQYMSKYRS